MIAEGYIEINGRVAGGEVDDAYMHETTACCIDHYCKQIWKRDRGSSSVGKIVKRFYIAYVCEKDVIANFVRNDGLHMGDSIDGDGKILDSRMYIQIDLIAAVYGILGTSASRVQCTYHPRCDS